MNPTDPTTKKLVSLQETAQQLGVAVDTLLYWNEHQILKPTITLQGEIGYTQEQITQFLTIRGLSQAQISVQQPQILPTQTITVPVAAQEIPVAPPASPVTTSLHLSPLQMFSSFTIIAGLAVTLIVAQPGLFTRLSSEKETSNLHIAHNTPDVSVSFNQDNENHLSGQNVEHTSAINMLYAQATPTPTPAKKQGKIIQLADVVASTVSAVASKVQQEVAAADTVSMYYTDDPQTACADCSETDVIDKSGNIKGDVNKNLLASIQGIGAITNDASQQPTSSLTLLFSLLISGGGVLFLIRKQFAYHAPATHVLPQQPSPQQNVSQTVLEVDQKTDGTVVCYFQGKEYKISKPELYSESDQFIERLMQLSRGVSELEYDSSTDSTIKFLSPLSRLVTRLGFVGIKRDLFFPRTAKDRVLFRRVITMQDLADMNLSREQIATDISQLS